MNYHTQLRTLVFQELKQKFTLVSDELLDRLNYELSHFKSDKVCQHVLDWKRIVDVCNRLNIVRSPGRGFAASSLVLYCLDITIINPLDYELHFERICAENEIERINIQTDIPAMSIGLVLNEIQKEFPDSRVAKVMVPVKEREDLSGLLVTIKSVTFRPHVCAVVIVSPDDERLIELNGDYFIPFVDYHKDEEKIWHYRFNLLLLDHLNPIQKRVNKNGSEYHPRNYPLNDRYTYKLFSRGETAGIYSFESDSMKKYARRLKPDHIMDIALLVGAFRPESLQFLPEMIKSKHSLKIAFESVGVVEKIAAESYGIPFYQETFVELMEKLAGFSRKKAWKYFVSLFKNEEAVKDEFSKVFIDGCNQHEVVTNDIAKELAKYIINHASNSFNKSHSVCYGLMAYWMGYYKVHFSKKYISS